MKPSQVRDKVWILENIRFVNTFWGQGGICPVNLYLILLFPKHRSVCDPKKKLGPEYELQKAGCKKEDHCYLKREEA